MKSCPSDNTTTLKQKNLDDKKNMVDPLANSLNIINATKYGNAPLIAPLAKKKEVSSTNLQNENNTSGQTKPKSSSSKTKQITPARRNNSKSKENIPHANQIHSNSFTLTNTNKFDVSSIDANFRLEDVLGIKIEKRDKAISDMGFLFDGSTQKSGIPYHKEGNIELYKEENVKKREALKTHKLVSDSIYKFMRVYKFDRDGRVDKDEYIRVHTKLAKIFRNDLKDKGIKRLMEEEWKNDSKGKEFLERQDLFNSLFELADIWTPDIDPFQYSGFYEKLFNIFMEEENKKAQADGLKNGKNPYDIM